MKERPLISVVIPCFNAAGYLPDAIESVLRQSLQNFEVILVDDGSTDNTKDIIEPYQSRVRYVRQPNRGPGAARNTGIGIASGEYIVFLDADDILHSHKFESQASFLKKNPEIGVVFSDVVCFSSNHEGEKPIQPFPTSELVRGSLGAPEQTLAVLAIQNIFPPLSAMVRRSCIENVGGFDETRELIGLEDWDLWYRLAHNHNFYYLDKLVGRYRMVPTGVSQNREGMKKASRLLENKIEISQGFRSLKPADQSDFYFCWGVQWLVFGEPGIAVERFRKAIQADSGNLFAWAAYVLSKSMGKRAVLFYQLKRKVFGPRGNSRTRILNIN